APAGSGIRSFANKPKGAGFELIDSHEFLWNVLATDVDFGMDGSMYVSDWVNGWGLTGKGRIWKLSDPEALKDPAVAEAKKLLAEGFDKREPAELAKLLGHADRRGGAGGAGAPGGRRGGRRTARREGGPRGEGRRGARGG